MAFLLPYVNAMNKSGGRRGRKERGSVILWRPDVVLASVTTGTDPQPRVRLVEPHERPENVRARVETARSILGSLAEARETLTAQIAEAHDRARAGQTERGRVSATIQAYRLEAALDDVLTTASTQVSLLMKERGLR
jgi:hypothetical protein